MCRDRGHDREHLKHWENRAEGDKHQQNSGEKCQKLEITICRGVLISSFSYRKPSRELEVEKGVREAKDSFRDRQAPWRGVEN